MINRNNDTLASKINRLSEFFSYEDLDDWTTFIVQHEYDFDRSVCFLDAQVRAEYCICSGERSPDIYDWMKRYEVFMHGDILYGKE